MAKIPNGGVWPVIGGVVVAIFLIGSLGFVLYRYLEAMLAEWPSRRDIQEKWLEQDRPKQLQAWQSKEIADVPILPDSKLTEEIVMMDDEVENPEVNEEPRVHAALVKFTAAHPELNLPALPQHTLEYKGWLSHVFAGMAQKKEITSIEKYTAVVKAYSQLVAVFLELGEQAVTKLDLTEQIQLAQDKIETKRLELQAQQSVHKLTIAQNEAAIKALGRPAPVSRLTQKEENLKEAKVDAELSALRTAATPPTAAERIEHELIEVKDLEEWKKSWPADESEEMKQTRLRVYRERRARAIDKA